MKGKGKGFNQGIQRESKAKSLNFSNHLQPHYPSLYNNHHHHLLLQLTPTYCPFSFVTIIVPFSLLDLVAKIVFRVGEIVFKVQIDFGVVLIDFGEVIVISRLERWLFGVINVDLKVVGWFSRRFWGG